MTELVEKQALIALVSEPLKERLKDTLCKQLDDALICTRTWDAWRYNTMSEDDFEYLAHDEEWIEQLADAILATLISK